MNLFKKKQKEQPQKPSYRQLDKQVNNGRELIRKVTSRIQVYSDANNLLREQVKSSNTYLALAVFNQGEAHPDGSYQITIPRKDAEWAMQNLKVSGTESEDKQYITLKVEVKPAEEEEPDYNIVENCQIHKGEFTKGCPEIESFACCECCTKPDCDYRHSKSSMANGVVFPDTVCSGCDKLFNPNNGGGTIEQSPYCNDCLEEVLYIYRLKGIEVVTDGSNNYCFGKASTESNNDKGTGQEGIGGMVCPEVESGRNEAATDPGDTFIPGSSCVDVQGETDAAGICATDSKDFS